MKHADPKPIIPAFDPRLADHVTEERLGYYFATDRFRPKATVRKMHPGLFATHLRVALHRTWSQEHGYYPVCPLNLKDWAADLLHIPLDKTKSRSVESRRYKAQKYLVALTEERIITLDRSNDEVWYVSVPNGDDWLAEKIEEVYPDYPGMDPADVKDWGRLNLLTNGLPLGQLCPNRHRMKVKKKGRHSYEDAESKPMNAVRWGGYTNQVMTEQVVAALNGGTEHHPLSPKRRQLRDLLNNQRRLERERGEAEDFHDEVEEFWDEVKPGRMDASRSMQRLARLAGVAKSTMARRLSYNHTIVTIPQHQTIGAPLDEKTMRRVKKKAKRRGVRPLRFVKRDDGKFEAQADLPNRYEFRKAHRNWMVTPQDPSLWTGEGPVKSHNPPHQRHKAIVRKVDALKPTPFKEHYPPKVMSPAIVKHQRIIAEYAGEVDALRDAGMRIAYRDGWCKVTRHAKRGSFHFGNTRAKISRRVRGAKGLWSFDALNPGRPYENTKHWTTIEREEREAAYAKRVLGELNMTGFLTTPAAPPPDKKKRRRQERAENRVPDALFEQAASSFFSPSERVHHKRST